MNVRIFFAVVFIALSGMSLFAQSPSDALRFSQNDFGGTARNMGVAGAFNSLGGDFSVVGTNPAGLGFYSTSELSVSPSLNFSDSEATYLDSLVSDKRSNFNVNQFGVVIAKKPYNAEGKDWKSSAFALGFNRLANYNRQFSFSGYNSQSSLTEYYANVADGIAEGDLRDARPFDAGLAYFSYLINPDTTQLNAYTAIAQGGNVQQTQYMLEKGGLDEMSIALAGNYRNKLYLGLALGVPFVHYTRETTYSENDRYNVIDDFNNFTQTDMLTTNGIGVNAKFGVIYRPITQLRIGFAAHTPTMLSLKDSYSTTMDSNFETFNPGVEESGQGRFEYRLATPWRISTGISGVIGQLGFLSLDYEWADYSQMEYDADGSSNFQISTNQAIRQNYAATSTVRLGAELAYKIFRLRGGYALQTSPYRDTALSDNKRQSVSAGVGIREDNLFVDVAFVHHTRQSNYLPYSTASSVALSDAANNVVFTLGFRF